MNGSIEKLPALLPAHFFRLSLSVRCRDVAPKRGTKQCSRADLLPDLSSLFNEEHFADMSLVCSEAGLFFFLSVRKPFEESHFPNFSSGDCLELFIDTRDLKSAGYATRFCHHFLIFPQESNGIKCQEITHFRSEDRHPLCDQADLIPETHFMRQRYTVSILIPAHCLHGYDPRSFHRLGFAYCCHRFQGTPQHFALSSHTYQIAQTPSLWSSILMQ